MAPSRFTATQMLERLIAFETVSSDSNLALIDFVEAYLADHGVAGRRTSDASGAKANLFATLGPARPGGVVLSGHTDVVPVEGQPWSYDPFRLTPVGTRLYGRGTADMKSFLAVALALVPEALAAGLRRPLHLALSYDEEVGCFGVHGLIADMGESAAAPALAIVGEPTGMRLVNSHKGVRVYRTTVTGLEAHSAYPDRAANAIAAAAELISFLGTLGREMAAPEARDARFDPPYGTFNIGTIAGGTAQNIVPRDCSFTWEYRDLPGQDPTAVLERFTRFAEEEVLPRLRETAPAAEITTESFAEVPALQPEDDSPAEALIRRLTGANLTETMSFASEAGIFQRAGIPTVLFGPGSILQAHQPDEFIETAQLEACEDFLRKLIAWAAETAKS